MGRRFRAFYFAAFAVAAVGLIGSWFVPNRRVAPAAQLASVASHTYDSDWYTLYRPDSLLDPPMAMLVVPNFLLRPRAETPFDFGATADGNPEADTYDPLLFGEGPLPDEQMNR